MCVTTDRLGATVHRRCVLPTRLIARASTLDSNLKSFQGALQADTYAGFHHLYDGGVIYEVWPVRD
jgi:hypothetical protein